MQRDEEGSIDCGPWKPSRDTDLSRDADIRKVQSLQQTIKEQTRQLYLPEDTVLRTLYIPQWQGLGKTGEQEGNSERA